MSAIWGIIHLNNKEADETQGVKMQQALKQYKLDRCHVIKEENAVFGCGIQYITAESVLEQLPYYDEHNGMLYTADCMLDNRQELINKLLVRNDKIPDGSLLYQAYLNWGSDFTNHVLGVFSFVIYDRKKNTCTLFTDHTGSRSLYYCLVENSIYFATIFAPLLAVLPNDARTINDKWISACELDATPATEFFPGLTPFEQIHQVLAGHSIEVKLVGTKLVIKKKCYWRLKTYRELKLKSQEEYSDIFLKTLNECVKSVLRSTETGITLSSGLDSTSVACTAARILQRENKKLYSFTSVPLSEYVSDLNPYFITNESKGVKEICDAYPNIVPEFVDCKGKTTCTELKRLVRYLECPHKSRQNMVWLDEIYERAAIKGCKVVMKGQYGNATISQGKILGRVYEDTKKLRFFTAVQQMNLYCKKEEFPRKRALLIFMIKLKKKLWYSKDKFEGTMVKKELLDKYNIIRSVNKICKAAGSDIMLSKRQRLIFMYDMNALSQLGAMDTRFGLYHGIIIRDPLKDKRMIELCACLPINCFVQEGVERAAVRKYMKGIVPDSILDIINNRGLQGADYITRLNMDWDRTKDIMLQFLEQPRLLDYIELNKLEHIKAEIKLNKIVELEENLIKVLMLCSCSIFLGEFG